MKTRNSDLLQSFVAYCEAHPNERFWQALRNWCGWSYVLVARPGGADHGSDVVIEEMADTFHWEENRKPPE